MAINALALFDSVAVFDKVKCFDGAGEAAASESVPASIHLQKGVPDMSDGREEREELRERIERERLEEREKGIERGDADEWEPERVDS